MSAMSIDCADGVQSNGDDETYSEMGEELIVEQQSDRLESHVKPYGIIGDFIN